MHIDWKQLAHQLTRGNISEDLLAIMNEYIHTGTISDAGDETCFAEFMTAAAAFLEAPGGENSADFLRVIAGLRTRVRMHGVRSHRGPERYTGNRYLQDLLQDTFTNVLICRLTELPSPGHQEKLALNLSVAQLALLVRLQVEEGLYRSVSTSELLRFTAKHFRSKRQDDFSFRNLSKEYYGANQATAAAVRDLLVRMLSRINKNFFPALVSCGLLIG